MGGSAVEFYSLGGYSTADVDLVVGDRLLLADVLEQFGFVRKGRFWYREDIDMLIECPGEDLAGDPQRLVEVGIEDLVCPVIGIEDLIVDRLNGYVHRKWEDDGRWPLHLIAANRENLDLVYLRERAGNEGTVGALGAVLLEIERDEAD